MRMTWGRRLKWLLGLFQRINQKVGFVGKVIGPLQIRLLKRPLRLLKEPARAFQSSSLCGRQPFLAESLNALLNILLQLNHAAFQCRGLA